MKKIYIILFFFVFTIACKHKADFTKLPKVSFIKDIQPIIVSNCSQSGCHGASNAGSFKLSSYNEIMESGKVKASSPSTSKLYAVLKTLEDADIMPKKPYQELTEKQIQLVYVWIGQGALNN